MTEREFCYWLQGFFEVSGNIGQLNKKQTATIQDHLKLVFDKVTPSYWPVDTMPSVTKTFPQQAETITICSAQNNG